MYQAEFGPECLSRVWSTFFVKLALVNAWIEKVWFMMDLNWSSTVGANVLISRR
ncbi:hypothetical protein D3C72_2014260 [compost metagenome]